MSLLPGVHQFIALLAYIQALHERSLCDEDAGSAGSANVRKAAYQMCEWWRVEAVFYQCEAGLYPVRLRDEHEVTVAARCHMRALRLSTEQIIECVQEHR